MRYPFLATLTLWIGLAPTVAAQDSPPPASHGLNIGQTAPPFTLNDQQGQRQSWDQLRADFDYVALVFHRSADW